MNFATVLDIQHESIESTLREAGAERLESNVIHIKEYDFHTRRHFIPPIYTSHIFDALFDKLTKLSSLGLPLPTQSYHLILIRQQDKQEICLRSSVQVYGNIEIKINEQQYHSLVRSLEAGGMKRVVSWLRHVITYTYVPLQTVYMIYDWTHVSPFLYIKSPTQKKLIDALAIAGYSMDRVVSFSLEEVHRYYGIDLQMYAPSGEKLM